MSAGMNTLRVVAGAILALAIVGATPGFSQGCVGRGESRQLIAEGRVMPLPSALRQAGIGRNQVVDVQLCRAGGGYVYRVRVLQPGGAVRNMNIPAG
jgi:hypothetical protein